MAVESEWWRRARPRPAPEVCALEQLDLFRAHLLDEIRVEVDHMVMQLVAAVAVVQDAAKKAFGILGVYSPLSIARCRQYRWSG